MLLIRFEALYAWCHKTAAVRPFSDMQKFTLKSWYKERRRVFVKNLKAFASQSAMINNWIETFVSRTLWLVLGRQWLFLRQSISWAKCETTGALYDSITEYEIWNKSIFFLLKLTFSVAYSCLTPKVNSLKTIAKWLSTRGIFFDVYVLTGDARFQGKIYIYF